ncbi:MAG: 3-deoxy-7-phosphoheptulonate synthase [Verrucomicrobia bacterium]|nr:3-deoxy-7-phosphoheptulonate synthase [Verrucomicrobiota bacterium]
MLITIKKSASAAEIHSVQQLLDHHRLGHRICENRTQTVIGLEGNPSEEIALELRKLPAVEKATRISTPFKLASLAAKPEKTVIHANGVEIGGDKVVLMAGPCSIESQEQLDLIAVELKKAGVAVMRGSAFKPRSSPYSFQGMGEEGLKLHSGAQKKHQMATVTEVMNIQDVEMIAQHVDILQIGARNMQNFDLLKAVGKSGKPVILKRGLSATIEEWLLSAEYIMAHGNPDVILCERGIRTYETSTRNTLDLSSIPVVKQLTHLPVIVDPSHAAGRTDLIPALSKAAIAAGADGLLIEVHNDPKNAKSDGKQSLLPQDFTNFVPDLRKVAEAIGRSL